MGSPARGYVMRERAAAAERTREAILSATVELAFSVPLAQVTLPAVAERSGVAVQTVLRHFGSREGLLGAAHEWEFARVVAERRADAGQLAESLEAHVDHYERDGDGVMLLLGQETWEPLAARMTAHGRAFHREWVERQFAPAIADSPDPERLVSELVVATDLYTWKLLRRDRGLGRDETLRRIRRLVGAVLAADPLAPEGD